MILNSLEVMFGGQAGDGSLTTGDLIAGVFKRMGLEVYTYKDFPSRIRGGHTNYVIRAGERANYGMADAVDALVAFDLEAVEAHIDEMRPGGFVVFDNTDEVIPDDLRRDDVTWYEIPLAKIAKDELGLELVRNTISLGVLGALVGMDPEIVRARRGGRLSPQGREGRRPQRARDRGRRKLRPRAFRRTAERLRARCVGPTAIASS